jgi:hypothetical protein
MNRKEIIRTTRQMLVAVLVVWVGFYVIVGLAPSVFSESPWAYALGYDADEQYIHVTPKPRDCDFMHAPIGDKGCHYQRIVQVTPYSTNANNQPIISYDNGKTWAPLPEGQKVGKTEVDVSWERVGD